ncbi:MAG: RsmB/NOP family class I SAM-dependent RNA methyltransferase [Alphaproteobacteria bacterium]|nr:RsmB/NOP family class I SAM-dependent RNA methyltransferase [Alphaproteobacteria bacterium]NNF23967.1 RsmB/NOP family class I SAM-dependent RNA methyltransferase [Paracoccaceae bacterium]
MTPGARVAAAIDILGAIAGGAPAEQALTRWARASRFAGSGDRAAVRSHVFDVLRQWRSTAARGGSETGRGRMIGLLRGRGEDPGAYFTGQGHAPAPLTAAEAEAPLGAPDPSKGVALDLPDWLLPEWERSLGADAAPVAEALKARAPVFLRVNAAKTDPHAAIGALAEDGIVAVPHPLADTALEVTEGARRIKNARAFAAGLVELQDAASQAVALAALARIGPGAQVLDLCAGGGGKALAIAAGSDAKISAHDADPARMRDLPARAARAGARITPLATAELPVHAPFDLVIADVPCSGSGAWRRAPQGKWLLTEARLAELEAMQADILDQAAALTRPGGWLIYATCSVLQAENEAQITAFSQRHSGWRCDVSRRFTPLDGTDGFYTAHLSHSP